MSSLANTIRREDEAARRKQAQWEAEAEERQAQELEAEEAQEAPVRYSVTMTSEQYNAVYNVVLTAMCETKVKKEYATLDLVREFAAVDHAKAAAAMAILDSLNYEVAA